MTTSRTLLLLRHGKSDWHAGVTDDFSRPLSARGQRDSPRMGKWLAEHGLLPTRIACSPAVRTNQTALLFCAGAGLANGCIFHDRRLLHADLSDLLAVISSIPDDTSPLMLVGHNPGLEDLLVFLAGAAVTGPTSRKILPTAALAWLQLPDQQQLTRHCAQLHTLLRPRELHKEADS